MRLDWTKVGFYRTMHRLHHNSIAFSIYVLKLQASIGMKGYLVCFYLEVLGLFVNGCASLRQVINSWKMAYYSLVILVNGLHTYIPYLFG